MILVLIITFISDCTVAYKLIEEEKRKVTVHMYEDDAAATSQDSCWCV